jgi:hypothetical protein
MPTLRRELHFGTLVLRGDSEHVSAVINCGENIGVVSMISERKDVRIIGDNYYPRLCLGKFQLKISHEDAADIKEMLKLC